MKFGNAAGVYIEANCFEPAREGNGQWKPDIAEADNDEARRFAHDPRHYGGNIPTATNW
jgi:hypothetical protein